MDVFNMVPCVLCWYLPPGPVEVVRVGVKATHHSRAEDELVVLVTVPCSAQT